MPDLAMTILFAYSSPTLHHGSPRVLVDIITGLDNRRFRPVLLCPARGELTDFVAGKGIEVIIAKWSFFSKSTLFDFLRELFFFCSLLRKNDVRLLHLNELGWRDSLVVAARLLRIPVVLHLHVDYAGPIRGNWNLRLASAVIVVADALKPVFRSQPDIDKKLVTVHNGLDVEKFLAGKSNRATLGLPETAKVVGFVGQMVQAKGLAFLVSAAKAVLDFYPETIFLFVGRRVAGEEGFVDELIRMAKADGSDHALRFLDPRNDIPDVMKSLDVLVLPTLGEAFGKVLLEGMGAGVPVVASAVGGIPEIIDDGVNGLLVPPADVQALESALLRLLGDAELRDRLVAQGLRTVREKFSVENQVAKISAVYDKLLADG